MEATTEAAFRNALNPAIDEIDRHLAALDLPVQDRPLAVAIELLESGRIVVEIGGVKESTDVAGTDSPLDKEWFRDLYQLIAAWYQETYDAAMARKKDSFVLGLIQFRGTPALLRIPTSIAEPADKPRHWWLSYPDHVEPTEQPLSWLVSPPNLKRLSTEQRSAIEADAARVASDLRFIRSRLLGANPNSTELDGLTMSVPKHLQAFADAIVKAERLSILKSWWEIQMANESILKALLLQRTGGYPKTHQIRDLVVLAKGLGVDFDECRFDAWPPVPEMINLRYGEGTRSNTNEAYSAYCLTLELSLAVAKQLLFEFDMGKARFLVRALPWMIPRPIEPEVGQPRGAAGRRP